MKNRRVSGVNFEKNRPFLGVRVEKMTPSGPSIPLTPSYRECSPQGGGSNTISSLGLYFVRGGYQTTVREIFNIMIFKSGL